LKLKPQERWLSTRKA